MLIPWRWVEPFWRRHSTAQRNYPLTYPYCVSRDLTLSQWPPPRPRRYTYEIGPVNTMMEDEIVKYVGLKLCDFKQVQKVKCHFSQALAITDYGVSSQVDGIFTPGGSVANMYGLSMAKTHFFPESKSKGLFGMPPVHLYTSRLVRHQRYCPGYRMSQSTVTRVVVEECSVR